MRISDWSSDVCSSDLGMEFIEVGLDEMAQKAHQVRDLAGRTFPVFRGKGVERQAFQAQLPRGAGDAAHRLHPGAMPGDARQEALFRPASIAVHDNSNMTRAMVRRAAEIGRAHV